jgi:Integrase core domain
VRKRKISAKQCSADIRVGFERWRKECNTFRPHSSLNYRPAAPEAILTTWMVGTVLHPVIVSLSQEVKVLYL